MDRARARANQLRGLAGRWSPLLGRAASAFYLYTLLWLVLWAAVPAVVMQWEPVLITSGSMEPGVRAGDIVLAAPSDGLDLAPGTVVIFNDQSFDDRLVTHRISSIGDDGSYVTKGDANPGVDSTPLAPDEVTARPRLLISTVGVPLLWIEQGQYPLVAAWLLVTSAAVLFLFRRPHHGGGSGEVEDVSRRPTRRPAWRRAPRPGRTATMIAFIALVSLPTGRSAATLADSTENAVNSFAASQWEALIALDGGESHTCGVNDEGAVWCWGRNDKGQLGDGTTSDRSVPVQVVGPGGVGMFTNAVGIAAGDKHSCALKNDGTVWCWGLNNKGQLGNNSTSDSSTPVQVVGAGGVGTLTNVAAIAAGLQYSCGAKDDGTAWCWGLNDKGQLGNNSTSDSSTPVQVVGAGGVGTLTNVTEIATGFSHSCAAKDDGTAWCWGLNDKGQLGNNSTSDSSTPVQVVGPGGVGTLTNVTNVTGGEKHTCAAKDDGTAWCWGLNNKGQLGDNSTTDSSTPVQVVGAGGVGTLTNVAEIATGFSHSCAAKDDGTAWCWGLNNKGQLGNNSTSDSSTPVQVVGAGGVGTLTNVTEIAAGLQHACAAKDDGTAWCWGLNNKGQLGNNSTSDSSTPVQVVGPGGVGTLDTIILVGAGNTHTCAAKQTHTVWCWGLNNAGQLGDGSTSDSSTPVQAIGV